MLSDKLFLCTLIVFILECVVVQYLNLGQVNTIISYIIIGLTGLLVVADCLMTLFIEKLDEIYKRGE